MDKLKLVSPRYKGNLTREEKGYTCDSSSQFYPVVFGETAALFDNPDESIAKAYYNLYRCIKSWRAQSDRLTKVLESSSNKERFLPMLKAQNDNRMLFEDWASWIEHYVKPSMLLDVVTPESPSGYGYNFNYLLRDWVEQPSGVSEIAGVLQSLKRCLRLVSERGRACVLGMGTGRFGLELTRYFNDIWGIDASFGQVAQYHQLLAGDINFWQINSKNQLERKNVVRKQTASIPRRLKNKAGFVNYLWADALNAPVENSAFDWVFSIYFSDVKPLPDLVREVKRMLRPKGYFVHCGPLEYHFNDIRHHYSFDEFKTYFLENGFEVIHESVSYPEVQVDTSTLHSTQKQYTDKVLLLKLVEKGS